MPPPKVGSATVNLTAIAQRMQRANDELMRRDDPANNYPGSPPSQPLIDRSEAAGAQSALAQVAWQAGSKVWGAKAVVGGGASGWEDTLYDKSHLNRSDLENLRSTALRVLHSLVPYGATELPRAVLDRLPEHVDAYWSQTFGGRSTLLPEQRDAMVAFIRAAAED